MLIHSVGFLRPFCSFCAGFRNLQIAQIEISQVCLQTHTPQLISKRRHSVRNQCRHCAAPRKPAQPALGRKSALRHRVLITGCWLPVAGPEQRWRHCQAHIAGARGTRQYLRPGPAFGNSKFQNPKSPIPTSPFKLLQCNNLRLFPALFFPLLRQRGD